MGSGIFRRRRRRSNLIIALWLVVPVLISAAGIYAAAMEAARYPWMHWSRSGWWLLAFFSAPALIFGLYMLIRSAKFRRSMKDFLVEDKAIDRFEQEYRHGERIRFGQVVLTDSWLFNNALSATCLLPLQEAVWIYGTTSEQNNGRYGTVTAHCVKVHFRNGLALNVACNKFNLGQAMRAFAQRCPGAQFGYYDDREREWKEGAKQWRASL